MRPSILVRNLAECLCEEVIVESDSVEQMEKWLLKWLVDYRCNLLPMQELGEV